MMRIHLLEIPFQQENTSSVLHPVFIQTGSINLLVDCGYPGMLPQLSSALQQAGFSWPQVDVLFITHHDIDHYGCAAAIKAAHPHVQVWAPQAEQPYLEGRKKSIRLQQAEDLFDQLPPEHRPWAMAFQASLKAVEPVAVSKSVDATYDTELLPGLWLLPTPGHMPGHVSLYLPAEGVLIAADAVVVENGQLAIANPAFTLDLLAAFQSAARLAALPANEILCYHGGRLQGQLASQWQHLLQQSPAL